MIFLAVMIGAIVISFVGALIGGATSVIGVERILGILFLGILFWLFIEWTMPIWTCLYSILTSLYFWGAIILIYVLYIRHKKNEE